MMSKINIVINEIDPHGLSNPHKPPLIRQIKLEATMFRVYKFSVFTIKLDVIEKNHISG